jgi:hypothetical protein
MNNSYSRLIDGTIATLRTEVLPRIDDDYARSQVWGVVNLLNTLKVRGDWSSSFLLQQLEAQRRGLAGAVEALAGAPGLPADVALSAVPVVPPVSELLAARDQGNLLIGRLLEWLAEPRAGIDAAAQAAAEAALVGAMRAEVETELKSSPRPLFAQMSGAADG